MPLLFPLSAGTSSLDLIYFEEKSELNARDSCGRLGDDGVEAACPQIPIEDDNAHRHYIIVVTRPRSA
jgi:hypothetical protein